MRFEKHDLIEAFAELGSAAWKAGKVIDLCVYGGSCPTFEPIEEDRP